MHEKKYWHRFQEAGSTHANPFIADLIQQGIDSLGQDVVYIPLDEWTSDKIDYVFGELKERNYTKGYGMRMMTNESLNVQGSVSFSKFGFLDFAMENTFYVTIKEYFQRITGFVTVTETEAINGDQPTGYDESVALNYKPKIGDLIWQPLHNKLFEVTLVDNKENAMWQKYTIWKISAKLYKPDAMNDTVNINTSVDQGLEIGALDIAPAAAAVADIQNVESVTPAQADPTATGNGDYDSMTSPQNKNITISAEEVKVTNSERDIFGDF